MLIPTLLILTLTGDGGVLVTLSDSETLEDCDASRDVVTQILTEGGVTVVKAMCGQTDLRLTPFQHGMTPEQEKYRYRVEITGDVFTVAPLRPNDDCTSAPDAVPAVYCARSAQSVIGQ